MSYTYSTGQTGSHASLSINTGTVSTPVWVPIEQILSPAQSGKKLGTVKATNLQSTVQEVLVTLPDSGEIKVSCIRVPSGSAPGQAAVATAFNLGSEQVPVEFKLALAPDAAAGQTTTGDSAIFTAYVTELDDFSGIDAEGIVKFEFTLKVVSLYTPTAGS